MRAGFGVSWAGEQKSRNWLHVAREYTEKFLHQQQIRDAVCRPALLKKEYYFPFLNIIMYALPVTYKDIQSPEGSVVSVHVPSERGRARSVIKSANGWVLSSQPLQPATATVTIDPNIVWQLFSKSILWEVREVLRLKAMKHWVYWLSKQYPLWHNSQILLM